MTEVSKFAHLATNNQFSTNRVYITASTDKKCNETAHNFKGRRSDGSLWSVSLQ